MYNKFRLTWKNISLIAVALIILCFTYLFQRFNFFGFISGLLGLQLSAFHPYLPFIFNKTLRLIVNDMACFLLIYALFLHKSYLRVAFLVFLFEILILLPFYFSIKLYLEGDSEISSPLLSHLHRLIINPTLMILLIVGFFYQRLVELRTHE